MISTKQLRYFDALARIGHFGRAAEHCAVTQPALSMQISQLEQHLGVILVERRSNGIAITAAGREVARRTSNILLELRGVSEFAESCRAPFSTPIRLGVIPTVAPYLLPKMLPCLSRSYPQLKLHIRETQTKTLIDDLLSCSLDLLVVALPIDEAEIETMDILLDRFLLAVPAGDPLHHEARVSPDVLNNERLLLLEDGHCFRDQALAVCQLRPFKSSEVLGAASLSTLVQMVANGLGVTLLPQIGASYEAARSGVKLIRFTDPEPKRVLGLAWRKSSSRKTEFSEIGCVLRTILAT